MLKSSIPETRSLRNPTSKMAFAVAVCALTAAGVGAIVNHWMTGWMAIGGMTGVGLFYFAIGLLNLKAKHRIVDHEPLWNASQWMAQADNLYAEPLVHSPARFANLPESAKPIRRKNND